MANLAIIVLCALVAVAVAVPERCSSPGQWEAQQVIYDTRSGYVREGNYAYDSINRRKAHREIVVQNSTRSFYHNIELFNENVMYVIDRERGTCTKEALRRSWRPHEIAPDALFDGETIIGSSAYTGGGVDVERWSIKGNNSMFFQIYTKVGCIPVRESLFEEDGNQRTEMFVDVTEGLHDPNIFIPPPQCN